MNIINPFRGKKSFLEITNIIITLSLKRFSVCCINYSDVFLLLAIFDGCFDGCLQ